MALIFINVHGDMTDDGGFENWFKKLEKIAWEGDRLDEIFRQELVKHKLEIIPESKILKYGTLRANLINVRSTYAS